MMTARNVRVDGVPDMVHTEPDVIDAVDVSPVDTSEASPRLTRLLSPLRWKGSARAAAGGAATSPIADTEPSNGPAEPAGSLELLKLVQRLFLPVGVAADGYGSVVFAAMTPWVDGAAADTAETLAAHTGRRVCLVDANLRDPILHRRYSTDNVCGWADLASGSCLAAEAAVNVLPRLWLVPAGPRRPDRELSHEHLRSAVASLISQFDFVIFSVALTDNEVETATLASLTDGLVMVVDGGSVRRAEASRAVEHLRSKRTRVLGAVLRSAPTGRRTGGQVHG